MTGPAHFQVERSTHASRVFLVASVIALVALVTVPWWGTPGAMHLIAEMAYYLALAQLWNLLAGYAGLMSVGQQVFVGLGGYAFFILADWFRVHPLLGIAGAGLFTGLMAIPLALIVFRLRGAYFAIGTWVVAEAMLLFFAQNSAVGGMSGFSLRPDIVRSIADDVATRGMIQYWVALVLAVGITAAIYLLLRSKHGLALTAIRDNETASASLGVDTYRTKMLVYVVTAIGTGLVGAFIFLQKVRISPEAGFSVNDWTVVVIFMVVIGGIGTLEGPLIGMLLYFLLRELLADYGTWYLIVLGVVAVVIMLRAREGIWGMITQRTHVQLFPVRRRLIAPASPHEAATKPRAAPTEGH